MTLSNQTSKNIYVGDDATLVFAYTFRIFEDADLEVTIQDTSVDPQTEITLVLNSDYTVSGADNPTGGNVTLLLTGQLSAAPTTTDNITIRRALPLTQPTDYVENDPFPADAHEDTVDRSRMIDQQLQEEIDRSLKLPANISGVDVTLPVPEAGAPIGWNDTGTGLTNNPDQTNLSQIDSAATPDFIGAAAGDGVLRTSGLLTYTDGGDFVTIGLTNAAIDHDQLTNFSAAEHFTMLDEDDLVSDSDTQAATQQSIKAYVDNAVALVNEYTELTDTPSAFTGDALEFVRVNAGETALEHIAMTASLVPIVDGGAIITATDVEGALQENRTAIDLNTAKVTNQTHTGDVTGSVALTVQPAAITGKPAGTVAGGDLVLIADIDDSNNLKQVTAQTIANLAPGTSITVEDEGTPLTTAVTKFNFAGAGVTVTEPVADEMLVTIPGGGGGGATLTQDVNQTTHGFSVGDWIYHNGTIYALADASDATTAESIGVVSAVAGLDDFTVQFGGRITGLSGLTAGEAHFLSETAGAITATAPTTEGAVIKPVLIADSTTTGFIFNMRGTAVTTTTSFYQSFTSAAGLTPSFAHNLGHKYVTVQVYNNNDQMIMPDDITLDDNDNLTVDLTSFGTRTGTWNVVILDSGTTNAVQNSTATATFTNGDLSAGTYAFDHDLTDQYPLVQVFDENDQVVVPDFITATSTSRTTIDLSSFGAISGTWRVVATAIGGTNASTPTATTFIQEFTAGPTVTINHNLGTQYNNIQVYDNNGDVIQPDDITANSTTQATIDITSFGTISGTWRAVVIGPGAYSSNIASDLNLTGQVANDTVFFNGTNWDAVGQTGKIQNGFVTRDMSLASGTTSVTGMNFKPSAIILFAVQDSVAGGASWGITDAAFTDESIVDNHNAVADSYQDSGQPIRIKQGVGVQYDGDITAYNADGFDITWTRTGAPTGTLALKFMAFR